MRSLWVGAVMAAGSLVAGCMFVMGSTDGYTATDAGEEVAGCSSSTQCDQSGDAGEQFCCSALASTTTAACQPRGCALLQAQLCLTNAECGGGSCILQECAGGPNVKACGVAPWCVALDGG